MILSNLSFIPPQDLGTPPMSDSPWALLPTASNHAANLDALYVFLTIICGISMLGVVGAHTRPSTAPQSSTVTHDG